MQYPRRILAFLLMSSACALGDAIITTDGQRLEGELKRLGDNWRVTMPDGKTVMIPVAQVRAIELTNEGAANGMDRLHSLRRSVESNSDIPRVIERYRRFIEQTKDKAVLDAALADLKVWQDRLDRGLVRVGKRWMTEQERQANALETIEKVNEARRLIKSGSARDAEALVGRILESDPQNVSALYLQGVLMLKADKPADARKALTSVAEAIPDHAPTLHNLSIILMRQRQWGPACTMADQALASAPNVQFLIDSAAELLELLPDDQKKIAAAQKLAKRFAEQDAGLQKAMEAKGMYRWGATWVDKATADKLSAAEAETKARLDELQSDFDLTQNRITRIDAELAENERAMRELESRSWVRAADGTLVRVPLPAAYYDMQRDVTRLRGERQEMLKRLDALRDAAKRAKTSFPVPKYTGTILPIAEDGVPIVVPEGVTLEPPPPHTRSEPAPPQPTTKPEIIIKVGPSRDAQ